MNETKFVVAGKINTYEPYWEEVCEAKGKGVIAPVQADRGYLIRVTENEARYWANYFENVLNQFAVARFK